METLNDKIKRRFKGTIYDKLAEEIENRYGRIIDTEKWKYALPYFGETPYNKVTLIRDSFSNFNVTSTLTNYVWSNLSNNLIQPYLMTVGISAPYTTNLLGFGVIAQANTYTNTNIGSYTSGPPVSVPVGVQCVCFFGATNQAYYYDGASQTIIGSLPGIGLNGTSTQSFGVRESENIMEFGVDNIWVSIPIAFNLPGTIRRFVVFLQDAAAVNVQIR